MAFFTVTFVIAMVVEVATGDGAQAEARETTGAAQATAQTAASPREAPMRSGPGILRVLPDTIKWNTDPWWAFRVLWTDRSQTGSGGAARYSKAIDDGAAHRIDFHTLVCVLEIDPGFKYWATDYRVRVLEGPLAGTEGWLDYDSLNGDGQSVDRRATSCDRP